jgi:hypothetical protein
LQWKRQKETISGRSDGEEIRASAVPAWAAASQKLPGAKHIMKNNILKFMGKNHSIWFLIENKSIFFIHMLLKYRNSLKKIRYLFAKNVTTIQGSRNATQFSTLNKSQKNESRIFH